MELRGEKGDASIPISSRGATANKREKDVFGEKKGRKELVPEFRTAK